MMSMGIVIWPRMSWFSIPCGALFGIDLSSLLTWGAFTYPVAFGHRYDQQNIWCQLRPTGGRGRFCSGVGLTIAAALVIASGISRTAEVSIWWALFVSDALVMLRTAVASGSAFLVAQLLDIKVFDALRAAAWWKAPTTSSLLGSVNTAIFFSLAFAGTGLPWVTWAVGDFCVKLLMVPCCYTLSG